MNFKQFTAKLNESATELDKHISDFSKGVKSSAAKHSTYKSGGGKIHNMKHVETDSDHQKVFDHLKKMGYKKTSGYDPKPNQFDMHHNRDSMTSKSDPVHHSSGVSAHIEQEHGGKMKVHFTHRHMKEEVELDEATVNTKKYSWGTMKTVHHGADFSIPLHPEHHQAIAKLKDEQEHHFKDETGRHWTARRKGDDVHFQGANGGSSTKVPHSTMSEETELDEDISKMSTDKLKKHWDTHKDQTGASPVFAAQLKKVAKELAKRKALNKEEVELDEKLNPSMGAGEYIKDFQKSDAPQFKGKSKEKKRMMGIAAYLQAKRDMKEQAELEEGIYSSDVERAFPNGKASGVKTHAPVAPVPPKKKEQMKPRVGHPTNKMKEEVEMDEAFINGREYASHGLMHPDHAKMDIHQPANREVDFYASKTGNKMSGKVMKNDGKQVHIQAHKELGDGKLHKFKVTPHLPKSTNEEVDYIEELNSSDIAKIHSDAAAHHAATLAKKPEQKPKNMLDKVKDTWAKADPKKYKKYYANEETKKHVEIEEGLQQTLRKIVPGYAKRVIDKKMDAEKFGRTDVDKDANFYRYKKIQDKLKKEEKKQDAPFDGPYKKTPGSTTDKSGAVHTPMSRARHLARMAMQKKMKEEFDVEIDDALADSLVETVLDENIWLDENLVGGQKKLDKNNNGKLDAEDFKKLRKEEKECPDCHKPMSKCECSMNESIDFDDEGNLVVEKISYSNFIRNLQEIKLSDLPVRKVTGRAYGGGAQKDAPEHDEDDDKPKAKPEPAEKRGRGRPVGSKSGANQKVTSGTKRSGVDYTGYKLHLPNTNKSY